LVVAEVQGCELALELRLVATVDMPVGVVPSVLGIVALALLVLAALGLLFFTGRRVFK
jgi:hypothetical protein